MSEDTGHREQIKKATEALEEVATESTADPDNAELRVEWKVCSDEVCRLMKVSSMAGNTIGPSPGGSPAGSIASKAATAELRMFTKNVSWRNVAEGVLILLGVTFFAGGVKMYVKVEGLSKEGGSAEQTLLDQGERLTNMSRQITDAKDSSMKLLGYVEEAGKRNTEDLQIISEELKTEIASFKTEIVDVTAGWANETKLIKDVVRSVNTDLGNKITDQNKRADDRAKKVDEQFGALAGSLAQLSEDFKRHAHASKSSPKLGSVAEALNNGRQNSPTGAGS